MRRWWRAASVGVVLSVLATLTSWVLPTSQPHDRAVLERETVGLVALAAPSPAAAGDVAEHGDDGAELPLEVVAALPGRVQTEEILTRPFNTVGVELDAEPCDHVLVRWRWAGAWSSWSELEVEPDEGPDENSSEYRGGIVSAPMWVGRADGYQFNLPAAATDGDIDALLVRATHGSSVEIPAAEPAGASLNAPGIRGRASWGARSPSSTPTYDDELKLAVVHHSATPNGYSADDVPALLRSIQAFHLDGRGWSDIAYNFVVDRFGRIWEGRGAEDRLVRGAHAQGFNTDTVGVMVLGEYGSISPNDAQLDAVADVIAWKFANERVDPASSVSYTSGGSGSIPAGQSVTLPRVVGHRDVGTTSCPGQLLHNVLWAIRARVGDRGPTVRAPGGKIDPLSFGPGQLLVSGWVGDPDTSAPIDVHVYLDGQGFNLGAADRDRAELASTQRRLGTRHGFRWVADDVAPGPHVVCVYAINVGVGSNHLVGCPTIEIPSGDPIGDLRLAAGAPDGRVRVAGFAVDPDTYDPIPVHVYVDGRGVNLGPSTVNDPNAASRYPLFGANHGFSADVGGFGPGLRQVCVFAINSGGGANRLLGCRAVTVPSGRPVGVVDSVVGLPDGRVSIAGWALDPDTAGSIPVHVYVDSVGFNLGTAAAIRLDVGNAYPDYGPAHGYGAVLGGLTPGTRRVCAFGINTGVGTNALLACRSVSVPGGSPFGSFDAAVSVGGGAVYVAGWAIDPDVSASIDVHVYVGSDGRNLERAAALRGDVAAGFPHYGPAHGFSATLAGFAPGPQTVCAYAINVAAGTNSSLGCREVVVT